MPFVRMEMNGTGFSRFVFLVLSSILLVVIVGTSVAVKKTGGWPVTSILIQFTLIVAMVYVHRNMEGTQGIRVFILLAVFWVLAVSLLTRRCTLVHVESFKNKLNSLKMEGELEVALNGTYTLALIDSSTKPAVVLPGISEVDHEECDSDGKCTGHIHYTKLS